MGCLTSLLKGVVISKILNLILSRGRGRRY